MQQEMKYIYTVYQKRSFSKAAEELYLTQPALSIAIRKVEEEIGMPIFDRSRKPLRLTAAGEIYIEKIRQIQVLEEELQRQIQDLSELHTGTLKIGGSHYLNSYVLPPVLAEFSRRYPGIQIQLTEGGSYELFGMLREHEIDATFSCTHSHSDEFTRRPLFKDMILVAVPSFFPINEKLKPYALSSLDILNKRHLQEDCPSITMEAFSDTPFVLTSQRNNLYKRSWELFHQANIAPPILLEVGQLVTAYHLTLGGMGATFICDRLVTHHERDTIYYKPNSAVITRLFDMILAKDTYISNTLQALYQVFLEFYPAP